MAIKVNGTTVINDSRQLQNVASLDATTVAAIGAAGVGGNTSYLGQTTFTQGQTVSYLEYDLGSAYNVHTFYMNLPLPTNAWGGFHLRLFNNGTLETGSKYVGSCRLGNEKDARHRGSPGDYGRLFPNRFDYRTNNYMVLYLTVTNATDSSRCTTWESNGVGCSVGYLGGEGDNGEASGYIDTAQNNNKIRLYSSSGSLTANAENFIMRYGTK